MSSLVSHRNTNQKNHQKNKKYETIDNFSEVIYRFVIAVFVLVMLENNRKIIEHEYLKRFVSVCVFVVMEITYIN